LGKGGDVTKGKAGERNEPPIKKKAPAEDQKSFSGKHEENK